MREVTPGKGSVRDAGALADTGRASAGLLPAARLLSSPVLAAFLWAPEPTGMWDLTVAQSCPPRWAPL